MDLLHTCLNVADADATADWYVEELGFERSWEFTTEDGATRNVYVAADNGTELQLSETEGETTFEDGTLFDHVAVSVADVDATFESMDHFGVVTEPGDQPAAGARTAFVKDPDGHVVELISPLAD
ncbi:MAG: VOC family protein [Haloarculaceae archaeon]